jgi:hypothetical protein
MRESLAGDVKVTDGADDINIAMVQKRINLKPGNLQRNMLQMDLFFDDQPHVLGTPTSRPFNGVIEFILTPTPMILTDRTVLQCKKATPMASNTNILYKQIIVPGSLLEEKITRFPQDFLATNANFPFFHDTLYLSLVFHGFATQTDDVTVRFAASLYMSYAEKKITYLRNSLGIISERFNQYLPLLERSGRELQRVRNLAGDIIPSFTWGGIRPELMVSGQTLSQYWLTQDAQEAESMQTATSLRTFAKEARQMVRNPEAFGTAATAQGNVPDWFSHSLPKGITAGAVRDQFPPRVTQDDPTQLGLGNIVCV